MRTNRKTEEKKMSMSKNIARLAVTAGLTAALSFGGVMAPVTMAFAEGATTGPANSITINKDAKNGDVKYKAYQIFKADVIDGKNGKVVSNIDWASDKAEKAVLGYLANEPKSGINAKSSAQDAAKYLTDHSGGTGKTTPIDNNNLFNGLAKAVEESVDQAGTSFAAGEGFQPKDTSGNALQGYYLFVTDESTLSTDQNVKKNTGTSPIFAVVGGTGVTVAEKTSIPTVDKQILDDTKDKTAVNAEKDDWKNVGDAWIGQVIDYKLTGTVADNIATYDKYQYVFQDHLSVGLDASLDSVVVTIGGATIPRADVDYPENGYTVGLKETKDNSGNSTGHDLTISFANLKAAAKAANVTLNEHSNVVVKYKATLTDKAEYTAAGNTNEVKLVYSNNPMVDGTGTSTSKRVTDHVFRLDVTKVEKDNQDQKLEATFQVKMTKEGDAQLETERWLTQTGGITEKEEEAGKFTTDKETGEIYIPGLVEGTYEITECHTPAGYNTLAPFTITVKPTYDNDGNLTNLAVTPSDSVMVTPEKADGATIPVTIQNKKGSGLPLTGLNGVTFTWIAGGAVLCIGVAHLIRSRKQAEESEQE